MLAAPVAACRPELKGFGLAPKADVAVADDQLGLRQHILPRSGLKNAATWELACIATSDLQPELSGLHTMHHADMPSMTDPLTTSPKWMIALLRHAQRHCMSVHRPPIEPSWCRVTSGPPAATAERFGARGGSRPGMQVGP